MNFKSLPSIFLPFLLASFANLYLVSCNQAMHGEQNAVWVESAYFRGFIPSTNELISEETILQLGKNLTKYHIKYAYIFSGPYQSDGHLPEYAFSNTAIATVHILKQNYPNLVVLPWVGGVQDVEVFLENPTWVNNAIADTRKLVNTLNVNGIHVDLEYINNGDLYVDSTVNNFKPGDSINYGANVNSFHKRLREALPNTFISSVVLAPTPNTKPWKRKTSLNELVELTKYVDQISFLYYDTHISSQSLFRADCGALIQDIAFLKRKRNIEYLIAIGTFINEPELQNYRNMEIENIPNTLATIKTELTRLYPDQKIVDGIAIYCNWQTDQKEWNEFHDEW